MTFGERITVLRKGLKMSQDDLAKKVGTSAPIIGRYERNEIKPSIETAAKIAGELNVTVDYLLTGSGLVLDKKMAHRLELLEQLEEDDRAALLKVVDNYLTTAQLQTTHKKLNKKAAH